MPNTKVITATLFACISSGAWANCYDRDVLAGYLADRYEMTLTGWGLTDSGDMHELYQAPNGMWAVVQTTPARCSTLASLPHQHYGRLAEPPRYNKAVPPAMLLDNGEPM